MAFGVSGSGDAKISASRIAFSSADGRPSRPSSPSCSSRLSFPTLPSGPAIPPPVVLYLYRGLSLSRFRIADRVRRVGGTRPLVDANRAKRARLKHPDQLEPDHFEQREKR